MEMKKKEIFIHQFNRNKTIKLDTFVQTNTHTLALLSHLFRFHFIHSLIYNNHHQYHHHHHKLIHKEWIMAIDETISCKCEFEFECMFMCVCVIEKCSLLESSFSLATKTYSAGNHMLCVCVCEYIFSC